MKTTVFTTFFTLLMVQFGIAQNIRAKIIDAATGNAIPYANIRINESDNLVSNGEGYFSLSENNSQDETVIVVSYLGFVSQQLLVSQLKNQDLIIKLLPAVYELQDVAVSNVKPNPYEIMANVKANLNAELYHGGESI